MHAECLPRLAAAGIAYHDAAAPDTAAERDRLRVVNAQLLTALKDMLKHTSDADMSEADIAKYHNAIFAKAVITARAAIAAAEGR